MKDSGVETVFKRIREKVPWLRSWHLGILSALILIVCVSLCMKNNISLRARERVEADSIVVTERGVLAWIDAFTKRDFNSCDLMVDNQNNRLYNPLTITHSKDNRYYTKALNEVVSCVNSVGLISVSDSGDEFKVRVSLNRFEPVSKFDTSSVVDLRGRYLNGMITDTDFNTGLQDLYYSVYAESCFVLSDETAEFILTLSEYQFEGITFVAGTVDFVDLVLQESGLTANLMAFEADFKSEVDEMLKSGLDE